MPEIFKSRPGVVLIVTDPTQNVLPGKITLGKTSEFRSALISNIMYDQSTNQQFQEALSESVFIYVFGDHMGEVSVEGIAFPATCTGNTEGLAEILDFYDQNRASKTPEAITVTVGRVTIKGFLTKVKVTALTASEDPIGMMSRYCLTINALPRG